MGMKQGPSLYSHLFTFIFICLVFCFFVEGNQRLVSRPSKPTYVIQGTCVNLTWSYSLKQDDEISKIRFGEWGLPSYLKQTIVSVKPNDVIYTRSTYKSRISWIGNFSSSAAVQLCNVTKEDQKKYGVEIDIKGKTTLKDGLKLDVVDDREFTSTPSNITTVKQGSCVNLTWTSVLRKDDKISKLRFGEWGDPSYLKETIVSVKPHAVPYIRSTYKSRLCLARGLYPSTQFKVQLCNVTKEDQKMYGVEIDIWRKTTMKNGIQLNVIAPGDTTTTLTRSGINKNSFKNSAQFRTLVVVFVALCVIIFSVMAGFLCYKRGVRLVVPFGRMRSHTEE